MKQLTVVVISLLCCFCLQAQTISGRIYREGTDSAIVSASVYYNGSVSGTITDNQGRFILPAKQQQIPIIISCIGYQSATFKYEPGKPLIVHLKPKSEPLHEVTIRVNGMSRKEEEAIFKREFIRTSSYALSCTIRNLAEVNLFYNKKTGLLTADCDKPVIIENKKLGYTITYYLDKFARTAKEVYFVGNYIFKEDVGGMEKEQNRIKKNREDVYDGSRMQFIRLLWSGSLNKAKYKVYNPLYDRLSEDDIIIDTLGDKYIKLRGRIFVTQYNNNRLFNIITSNEELSFIDKDGFYSTGLRWSGTMGNQRVGDLLPFEYHSEIEFKRISTPDTVEVKNLAKIPEYADRLPNQKLTEAERNIRIFKNIVLTPDNPLSAKLVIKKWQQPIKYRFYGTCGDAAYDLKIAKNIHDMFSDLSVYCGLPMHEAEPDSTANFLIVLGSLPKFKNIIDKEAYQFFRNEEDKAKMDRFFKKSTGYYNCLENGFVNMIQLINTHNIGNNNVLWCQIKAQIMNGLGFFGQIGNNSQSLFYRGVNYWTPKDSILQFDKQIIKTLYQPALRSGMNEQDLNAVLANKQI